MEVVRICMVVLENDIHCLQNRCRLRCIPFIVLAENRHTGEASENKHPSTIFEADRGDGMFFGIVLESYGYIHHCGMQCGSI